MTDNTPKDKKNVIHVSFERKHKNDTKAEADKPETMADIFKRHKVLVPSDLIFKYK